MLFRPIKLWRLWVLICTEIDQSGPGVGTSLYWSQHPCSQWSTLSVSVQDCVSLVGAATSARASMLAELQQYCIIIELHHSHAILQISCITIQVSTLNKVISSHCTSNWGLLLVLNWWWQTLFGITHEKRIRLIKFGYSCPLNNAGVRETNPLYIKNPEITFDSPKT